MKLINKTKCPSDILIPLIKAAGKSIGARVSNVVVRVTQAHAPRMRGVAIQCCSYRFTHTKKYLKTDGGIIELVMPRFTTNYRKDIYSYDSVKLAKAFYKICQHEWAHILDFQNRTYIPSPTHPSGKRIRWKERPCEIFAMNKVEEAKEMPDQGRCTLRLAIWLEEQYPEPV